MAVNDGPRSLGREIDAALAEARDLFAGTECSAEVDRLAEARRGFLVVAVQGEVSSGKSTLVNALLGRHLSRTSLTTCTRVVTRYHRGEPRLQVHHMDRTVDDLPYDGGPLPEDELERYTERIDEIDHIDVRIPDALLDGIVIADYPGFNTMTPESKEAVRRSRAADAYIYVADLWKDKDVRYLQETRRQANRYNVCALNQVAVLGRIDTLGGDVEGVDRLAAARRMAAGNAKDFASVVRTVVPVSALLAESVVTGRVDEELYRRLQVVRDGIDLDFVHTDLSGRDMFLGLDLALGEDERLDLERTLDYYALRRLVVELDELPTVEHVRERLLEWSGIAELHRLIFEQFLQSAAETKLAMSLARLQRLLGQGYDALPRDRLRRRQALVDVLNDLQVHPELHRLAEANALMLCGQVEAADHLDEVEVARVATGSCPEERLGLPQGTGHAERARVALDGYFRWRERTRFGYSPAMQQIAVTMQASYLALHERARKLVADADQHTDSEEPA